MIFQGGGIQNVTTFFYLCSAMMRHFFFGIITVFLLQGLASSCSGEKDITEDFPELSDTYQKTDPQRYPKEEGVTRIVSYNVGTFNKYMANSITEVAEIITELKADAVIMNEVDSCTSRNPLYQVKVLAETLGNWNYAFGPALRIYGGAYGNAIVTSPANKVLRDTTVLLGRNNGAEERSLVVAECERFVLMGSHLDHTQEFARIQQAKAINAFVKKHYKGDSRPVFLLGDMNCEPNDAPLKELKNTWTVVSRNTPTYPTTSLKKCIDFVLVYTGAGKVTVTKTEATRYLFNGDPGMASDHIPIFVDYK